MTNDGKDIEEPSGINPDSLPRWLRDLIDYGNETAGRETGRTPRFLTAEEGRLPADNTEKKDRRFNELVRLLQDPNYARLYFEVERTVSDAREAVVRVLQTLNRESEAVQQRLKSLRSSAAELADGRKVYRSKSGRLYAEDGEDVTERQDSIRGLSPNTANWEEFRRAREDAEEIERRRREVETYDREVLDLAEQRLKDTTNPPDVDELRELLERTKKGMPPEVHKNFYERAMQPDLQKSESVGSAADEHVGPSGLNTPDLFAQFRSASVVVADSTVVAPARNAAPKVT